MCRGRAVCACVSLEFLSVRGGGFGREMNVFVAVKRFGRGDRYSAGCCSFARFTFCRRTCFIRG